MTHHLPYLQHARMAELADALDLGSSGRPWGFKSLYAHQTSPSRILRLGDPYAEVAQR